MWANGEDVTSGVGGKKCTKSNETDSLTTHTHTHALNRLADKHTLALAQPQRPIIPSNLELDAPLL